MTGMQFVLIREGLRMYRARCLGQWLSEHALQYVDIDQARIAMKCWAGQLQHVNDTAIALNKLEDEGKRMMTFTVRNESIRAKKDAAE